MSTQDEIDALREATREAHEVLKDLRRAIKDGRQLVKEAAGIAVSEQMKPVVDKGLKEFSEALDVAVKEATQSVFDRFDQIRDMLLGEDRTSKRLGKPSISELVEAKAKTR